MYAENLDCLAFVCVILTRIMCSQLLAKLVMSQSRATSRSAPIDKDSVWLYNPNAEEIWQHLCKYMGCAGKHCHPEAFQEYMLQESKDATSLSYIAKKLADYLFDKKVKELIKQQRSDLEQSSNNVPLLTYLSEYLPEASTAMTLDGMLTS